MTQPILRVLIQEKLVNGRSPRTHPRIWGGPPNGETCDGCEETATKAQRTLQDTPTMSTYLAMRKGLLRGLMLAAFAALGTMTCAASAGAAEAIKECGILSTVGGTYVLTRDLNSCGTCLVVTADRITIDLAGYTISGFCGGDGVTDNLIHALPPIVPTSLLGTTVKNGVITGFEVGIHLESSARNVIRSLEVSDNAAQGLRLGPRSLVKGCLIKRNGQEGIFILDFGQVQDCIIGDPVAPEPEGNGSAGINGGDHLLITHNVVVGNRSGIVVGEFSTVSFNTSSDNTVVGVSALSRSLVTGNITIGNGTAAGIATGGLSSVSYDISNGNGGGGIDIDVQCPSTVTNNQSSSGNSWNNYNFNGPESRCQTKNNR